jgi:hypothetical protein
MPKNQGIGGPVRHTQQKNTHGNQQKRHRLIIRKHGLTEQQGHQYHGIR